MTIQPDNTPQRTKISTKKRALLEQRLKGKLKQKRQKQSIDKRPSDGPAELSFTQQRLWFLYQLEPDSPFYNIPMSVRLQSTLNIEALQHSLNALIERHESLRTTFSQSDNHPVQVIAPPFTLSLPLIDLQHLPEDEKEAQLQRLLTEEAQYTFNISQGPLIRAALIQTDADDHVLLLNMHHLISDQWSADIFWRELALLYNAFSADKPSPLAELPIQYADFAHWHRQWFQGEVEERQLTYWKQQLGGELAQLQLPIDHPRPATQTYHGTSETFTIPETLFQDLSTLLVRERGDTVFMLLLAAFNTLLYRYTGQTDLLIGSPIANRNHPEIESLIGFFVNTLVLRTDLSGNPTFQEVLGRVNAVALNAYSHPDIPFEKLVEVLQPNRDPSYNPIFQVLFNFHNATTQTQALSGLDVTPLTIEHQTSKFDLTLTITQNHHTLHGSIEYNTDLFDASTIQRLIGHFQTLLQSIATQPELPISQLPLLSTTEREEMASWNETAVPYPDALLPQHFEAQVAHTPDAIAVVFDDTHLTYLQLNHQANQLAHHLQHLGVSPETLVALYTERSLEMVIAILAIFKAGGAYLPLDPDYPQDRLAYMLADSQAPLLLTHSALSPHLPPNHPSLLFLDTLADTLHTYPTSPPDITLSPDNLAYVIYTSGSTGKPKGVLVSHRGILNLAQAQQQAFNIHPHSHVLQFAAFGFDASVSEIFVTLSAGARLVLAPSEALVPGPDMAAMMTQHQVSVVTLPPSALAVMNPQDYPSLHTVVSAGEACPAEVVSRWAKDRHFVNAYGPTEATVCATLTSLQPTRSTPPIGTPMDNVQTYILDPHLQPVPIGVPGELCIAGVGLARGYHLRPDLTAHKFIPHPFSIQPGDRLYRTGDLARFLPDGNIEFLGRIDHQVKLRGYRIELGEIEAVLNQQPTIEQALVIVRQDTPADKRLVAYLITTQPELPIAELRQTLKQTLPDYMVPSAFVTLNAFPLTPNGKIDRNTLPSPELSREDIGQTYTPPTDALELTLIQLWQDALNVQPIGIHDNYFDLGGHSLHAVQLFDQINQRLGQNLPLATLFQAPTISELAHIIRQENGDASWSSLVPIQSTGDKPPFFCVHGGGGNVLLYRALAHHLQDDQPFYGFQMQGLDGKAEFHTRIEDMAAHYIDLMRSVQPNGPYLLGGFCLGGTIAFEMVQQLQAQGESVALLAILDATSPYYFEMLGDVRHRVVRQVKTLAQLPTTEAWDYLQDKVRRRISRQVKGKPRRMIKRLAPNLLMEIKAPPPDPVDPRAKDALTKASQAYTPKAYSGSATIFIRADEHYHDPHLGWRNLIQGEIQFRKVPGYILSREIFNEPYVQDLAKELQASLEAAGKFALA